MSAAREGRHAGDAVRVRLSQSASTAALKLRSRSPRAPLGRQPDRLRDLHQNIRVADVAAFDEVGAEQRVVDGFAARLRVGPCAQFLRQPAVVGHAAIAVGQALGLHARAHLRLHLRDVVAAPGKQWPRGCALAGRVRDAAENGPTSPARCVPLQPLNTPGTEIAPGSDVVGEDFEGDRSGHGRLSFAGARHATARAEDYTTGDRRLPDAGEARRVASRRVAAGFS